MYVFSQQVALKKGIATLLATALVFWVVGMHLMQAEAANLTLISDTLSNSAPSEASNHTFRFTLPASGNGIGAGQTIVITFPTGFNMGSVAFGDIDLSVGGVDQALAAGPSGATWGATVSGQVLTILSGSATAASGTAIVVEVGTNATFGGTGTNQVTNHASINSYEFTIVAGVEDSGQFRVAIVDDVDVTANVNTALTFTVSGVASGATVNSSPTTTATTTTSTSLPFETLTAGTSKTLAQDLAVTTNAIGGYVIPV